MELLLFKTFKKRTDSTKLVDITKPDKVCDVYLKQDTVYTRPVFTIESDEYPVYTYAYLAPLKMFYFVTSRKQQNVGYWEISLRLDSLATVRDDIAAYNCFVERCADSRYFNPNILDDAVSVEDMVSQVSTAVTSSPLGSLGLIVRILGAGSTGGIGTFYTTLPRFASIFPNLFADIDDGTTVGDIPELLQVLVSDPSQYILGVYTTPIAGSTYNSNGSDEIVYLGGHKSDVTMTRVNATSVEVREVTLSKPASIYSDFRKTDGAFSQYYLYIPTIGTVTLSSDLMDTTLSISMSADLLAGDLFFALKSNGSVVATYQSNCYSPMAMGGVNTAGGIISGAFQAAMSAGSLAGGNVGAVGGIVQGIKSAMAPAPSILGTQGGTGCVQNYRDFVITCVQKVSAEFPTTQVGRPCCKNLTLGSLSGFIKCGAPSIELAAESDVIDEVNNYLANGFYFE